MTEKETVSMDNLRKLQSTELEMLKTFDLVCGKYGIPYFVLFGTALGTVRHKGFIPWDDDIDVGILRSDYQKLKQIPKDEWNGFDLIDGSSDCFYHEKIFPRIYKPGTIFEAEFWAKYVNNPRKIRKPVWIDIFLFDYVNSEEEAARIAKKAQKLNSKFYYSRYLTNIIPSDSLKNKLRSVAKRGMHYWYRLLHTPEYYLNQYYDLVTQTHGKYLISYDSWRYQTVMDTFGPPDLYFPVRRMKFEDFEVNAPNRIENFLTTRFGDYMQLPPEDQRKSHIPQTIYLGEEH